MKRIHHKSSLNTKLKSYSILAGSLMGTAMSAEAGVVITDIDPDTVLNVNGATYDLDLNNDTVADFRFRVLQSPGAFYHIQVDALNSNAAIGRINAGANPVTLLPDLDLGLEINSNRDWYYESSMVIGYRNYTANTWVSYGDWFGTSNKYLGFRIKVGGINYFGWATLDVDSNGTSLTIKEYGFEDIPGKPSMAGSVFEAPDAGKIANLTVFDIANNGDGRDMRIAFDKVGNEDIIDSYRIIVVKSADADTFDLVNANQVDSANYRTVSKTGNDYLLKLDSNTNDKDGDPITDSVAYKLFVLTIADDVNVFINELPDPSIEITLSPAVAVLPVSSPSRHISVYSVNKEVIVKIDGARKLEGLITIYDITGSMAYQEHVHSNISTISLIHLPGAVYVVKVEVSDAVVTKKVFLK